MQEKIYGLFFITLSIGFFIFDCTHGGGPIFNGADLLVVMGVVYGISNYNEKEEEEWEQLILQI